MNCIWLQNNKVTLPTESVGPISVAEQFIRLASTSVGVYWLVSSLVIEWLYSDVVGFSVIGWYMPT